MQRVLPVPKEVVEQLARLVGHRPLAVEVLVMAVTPAICEEALFRGALLRGFEARLGRVTTVVLTAVLFGLFHLSVYRLVPATLLGVALGVVALRCGSLWPAILFHAVNNTALVVLAHYGRAERMVADFRLVIVAAVTFAAGLLLLGGRNRQKDVDPV
jgi:sodium transport system permease protein